MSFVKRLSVSIVAVTMGTCVAQAEIGGKLHVATGEPGSDSFAFGTELWAMSQIALMPAHDLVLEARKVAADGDRLALLQDGEVEAALVYGRVPNAYEYDVRAIMALWPNGQSSDDADPVQFLVHKTVSADVVYLITKAMFEHEQYFVTSHSSLGVGLPGEAMTGLDIPLHAGAFRYFQEHGLGDDVPVAADYWGDVEPVAGGDTATYRDFDDPALDPDEIEQITAACRQALETGSLTMLLGDLANTGCEVYQDRLVDGGDQGTPDSGQAAAKAATIAAADQTVAEGDAGDAQPLEEALVGQGGPAIRWMPSADPAGAEDNGIGSNPMPARVIRQPVM